MLWLQILIGRRNLADIVSPHQLGDVNLPIGHVRPIRNESISKGEEELNGRMLANLLGPDAWNGSKARIQSL